jgi:hypothetical protein
MRDSKNPNVNWQHLDMLPVFLEITDGQLGEARIQLDNMHAAKTKPHVLDDDTVNRIIDVYTKQNSDLWVQDEQCSKWIQQNPTQSQLQKINDLKLSIAELKKANTKIIEICKDISSKTIDKILDKSDMEVALDFLMNEGKLPS